MLGILLGVLSIGLGLKAFTPGGLPVTRRISSFKVPVGSTKRQPERHARRPFLRVTCSEYLTSMSTRTRPIAGCSIRQPLSRVPGSSVISEPYSSMPSPAGLMSMTCASKAIRPSASARQRSGRPLLGAARRSDLRWRPAMTSGKRSRIAVLPPRRTGRGSGATNYKCQSPRTQTKSQRARASSAALAAGFFYKTGQREIGRQWLLTGLGSLLLLTPFILHLAPFLGIRLGFGGSFNQVATEEQSLGERKLLDETANQLFENRPLTGVGLGAFALAQRAEFPNFPVDYQPAHLVLLEVAAETGIFGALFYMSLLLLPWLALWLKRRQLRFTPILIGASALLLAVSLIGLFDYYTWLLVPGRLLSWLAWGLWGASYRSASSGGSDYA